MSILYIEACVEESDFAVYAWQDETENEFRIDGKGSSFMDAFDFIYETIEKKKQSNMDEVKSYIADISARILDPLSDMISSTDHIAFLVDDETIRCSFDLLELNGSPLFLTHKISYIIDEIEISEKSLELKNAYCMADLSCDPEKGLKEAAKYFESSEYVEMEDASLKNVIGQSQETAALIISAHGEVDKDGSGSLSINNEEFGSESAEKLDTGILYLDSCQMGVAWDVIESCYEEGTADYYLAPITSNDAGDSSTITVTWFFKNLKDSGSPADALFQTRKKLYQHYSSEGLDSVSILNKAFVFRLYHLKDKE